MIIDTRSQRTIATLHRKVQGDFLAFTLAAKRNAAKHGCDYVAIQGTRTMDEQAKLYAKGRTAPGPKVTNAKPGSSWHNFGLAADYGVFKDGKYLDSDNPKLAHKVHAACGALAPTYHLDWGGNWNSFKDTPHYQHVPATLTLTTARKLHAAGKPIL